MMMRTTSKLKIALTLAVTLAIGAAGCEKEAPAEARIATEPSAEAPLAEAPLAEAPLAEAAPEAGGEIGDAAVAAVTVAPAGSRFDPAIAPEQLPEGTWYCDMGTVHYARGEKGDGNCAECGMALKQYDPKAHAALKAKAVEAHDHAGHAHGEGGHAHGGGGHAHGGGGHAHGEGGHAHGDHGDAH